jgi:ribosomal protein S18 acetylase RimI-like enzyme
MPIHDLTAGDASWAREFLERVAGAARMASRGRLHQCDLLPGFYIERDGRRTALLTYRLDAGEMEVVALYAAEKGSGDGSELLEAAIGHARDRGCRRVWLVTTNDNEPAIRFYRNRGMRLAAIHHGAVDTARRELKPEIPLLGRGGVPIRDEIEFEIVLERGAL